ncbi:MAG TPA: metal ABC transporter permease [Candidatus Acidoferrales bacterium]|jgi:ABC-type Mn2+/Zn2+ transport system permease subunit|nr:metal ABC transporter permease [Candidatus Acidoferrales bacterium]
MVREQALLFVLVLFFSLAAGLVGCVALMRRMLLAGDVISHLALPGLGLAFTFKLNPVLGGAATLFLGTFLVWQLQKKTGLATEAAIGVVFAAALAIGAAITPSENLAESLFGEQQGISPTGFLLGAAAVALVVFAVFRLRDRLALAIFSSDLAAATGVRIARLDLYFLLLFSLTVLVGLRFMGALLASSLIIMPSATARQLTNKLSHFFLFAVVISLSAVAAGFLLNAFVLHFSTAGPTIAIISATLFSLSLLVRAK